MGIVCSRTLIDGRNPDGMFNDRVHLAELVALLGPPSSEFRDASKLSSVFWDKAGMILAFVRSRGLSANLFHLYETGTNRLSTPILI